MADPTPSDIPDPASPTPASPAPRSGSGPVGGGSKRIRSMPDRAANTRPAGSIRSMPERVRESERGTGGYVDTLSTEKSWGRGLAILWALFLATMLMELLNAMCYLLAGKVGWPTAIDVGRLALVCTFFLSLWAGIRWLRPLFATVDFLTGAWILTDCILSYRAAPKFRATGQADWIVYSTIESFPKIAMGFLYLGTAVYVLFSDDVREFVAHRRVRGRTWPALVAAAVSYGCMLLIFAAQLFYAKWMQARYADAQQWGDDTMRTISENWDPNSIFPKLDASYAKNNFTKADREATFTAFKNFGKLKSISPAPVVPRAPMPQFPLQDKVPIPQGIDSHADGTGNGFELTAKYDTALVEFEHGRGKFGFDLVRDMSGPWRITKLNVDNVQYDRPPKPAATPAPEATPGTTGTPDATAPSPGASPSPAAETSGSASPAATAAPSAPPPIPTVATPPAALTGPTPASSPVVPAASPTP